MKTHRPFPAGAKPRSAVFTLGERQWYISIQVDVPSSELPHPKEGTIVGGDAGVAALMTFSDGLVIENPKVAGSSAKEIRTASRRLSRCKRGSKGRFQAVRRLRAHRRHESLRRRTYLHQVSARVTRDYAVIGVEKLQIKNLVRSPRGTLLQPGSNVRRKAGLNRAIHESGIALFIEMLVYKAERAGGRVVKVDARNTSILCSCCGAKTPKTLKDRLHRCGCGCVLDRDLNAARNILKRAEAVAGLGIGNARPLIAAEAAIRGRALVHEYRPVFQAETPPPVVRHERVL